MKRFTLPIAISSILCVILLTLLIAPEQPWTTVSEAKPLQDSHLPSSPPSEADTLCVSQSLPMAPGIVLMHLRSDITVYTEGSGVHTNDVSFEDVLKAVGAQAIEPVFPNTASLSSIYRLHLAPDIDAACAIASLSAHPAVIYAEPDYLAHIAGVVPNDPLYPEQWGLAQIDAPDAWDVVTGTADVVIAVIDAGLDTSHPDLANQLWTNPGEIAGNGVDDDNNGYIDDIHGWNFVDNNASLSDNTGHGTQVAGVIATSTNNSQGIAGMCWNCRLMIIKVVQPGGVANYSDIAAGVMYATQKGAEVINVSLGGYSDSVTLRTAVEAASQTAVVVGGAGNDNKNSAFYPAAYGDHVLAIAGTDAADIKTSASNYGTWVDASAPAVTITTTFDGGSYGSTDGTSMAAPFVSGLAGLLRSQHPDWSANEVQAQIIHTVQDIDVVNPGYAGQLGHGRIDAGCAVTTTAQPLLVYMSYAVDGEMNGHPEPGSTVDLEVTLYNDWAGAKNAQATLSTTDAHVTIVTGTISYGNIAAYESKANVMPFRFSIDGTAPYGHDMAFMLNLTANGGFSATIPLTIPTSPGITYVHGTLTSQTWTNDRTYVVDGEVGIAAGNVLTIERGTVVRFDSNYSFSVAGTLIADGTSQQPIRFTSSEAYPSAGDWGQIRFLDSCQDATFDGEGNYISGSIVRHAVIEYGQGVNLNSAAPYIAHNTLQYVSGFGIGGNGGVGIVIADNAFINTGVSLSVPGGGFSVSRNKISGATMAVSGPGLLDQNSVSEASGAGITANGVLTVTANRAAKCGEGMVVNGGYIGGNLLADNAGYGLRINGATPTVISNTVLLNGSAGIYIAGGIPIVHQNNLVASTGQYALYNATTNDIDAANNWWSTTDTADIQAAIYDGVDQFGLGMVDHSGYLSAPAQDAPAYVRSVTILPDTTLGIETGTFDIQFSRSMDERPDLTFWTTRHDTWQRFNTSNSELPSDNVRAVLIDKNGDRWFGTWDGVVVWRTDDTWQTVLPSASVYGLTLDANGDTVWVATNGMGTYAYSLDGTLLNHYSTPHQVMDVFIDGQDNKWIASWGQGLYLLKPDESWTHYTFSNSDLASDSLHTVAKDKSGNVWCGFGDAGNIGVSKLKPDETWETYTEWNSDLASNYVRTIAVDETGSVWFGTSSGLSVLRTDGTWGNYNINDGYAIAFIDGDVWVGEHRGVAILRDGNVERIPGVDPGVAGLPFDTVHDIAVDDDGSIWFATCCSNDPPGAAAVLWHGQNYEIDDGTWMADNIWRGACDVTVLIPRDTYTLSISSAMGADGIEIAANAVHTFTVDYAGQITDKTAPPAPSVSAQGKESDPSYVTASWVASDPDSSITGYRYAIGSSQGATDVMNWISTSDTSITISGLGLTEGHLYWLLVQARNTGGLWSTQGHDTFFAGPAPHKIYLPLVLAE
jgi:subtilisin family serine protease